MQTMAEVLRARGKLGPYTAPAETAPPVPEDVDPAAVREWAAAHGVKLASRGPIPATVLERYHNREVE